MTTAARGHRPRLQLEDLRAAAHRELLAEVARKFGEIRFKATGDSMLPSVWPGDLLTVRRQSFSEFRPGQIVLYERVDSGGGDKQPVGPPRGGCRRGPVLPRGGFPGPHHAPGPENPSLGPVGSLRPRGR